MKRILLISAILMFVVTAYSQTIPEKDSTYTFEDLYNRLESGVEGSAKPFFEPSSAPGSSTGKSLNDIMDLAPAKSDRAAVPEQVLEGRDYWSLDGSGWGLHTGTMTNAGKQDVLPSATDQAIAEGYHDGTGTVSGDPDLDAANIKTGVNIFDVDGALVEAGGTAYATQVLAGVGFSKSDSAGLTGTMYNNGALVITPSGADQHVPEGYHNGSGLVVGDPDLDPANIKEGVDIYGVSGSFDQQATAAEEYIVAGKTAWVNGVKITGMLKDPLKREALPAEYYIGTVLSTGNSTLGGDTIILHGVFDESLNDLQIGFDGALIDPESIIETDANDISFITPAGTGFVDINLEMGSILVPYALPTVNSVGDLSYSAGSAPWNYAPPVITSVSGCTDIGSRTYDCEPGNTITVSGNNFGTDADDLEIYVASQPQNSIVLTADQTEIQFVLSDNENKGSILNVLLSVNGQSTSGPYLTYLTPELDPFGVIEMSSSSESDTLVFSGSHLPLDKSIIFARLGSDGQNFEMMNFEAQVLDVTENSLTLITPVGCIGDMTLLVRFASFTYTAEGYLRYPKSVLLPGTLRGSLGAAGSTIYTAPENTRTRIYFGAENIPGDPSHIAVYYGPPGSSTTYQCTDIILEDDVTLSGITENAFGEGYVIKLRCFGNYSEEGTDLLGFPSELPQVTSVSGCADNGNNTAECPTGGGPLLVIEGTGFTGTTGISIGGKLCMGVNIISSTMIECPLPEGTGRGTVVAYDQSAGNLNESTVYVEYGTPRIVSVSGCTDLSSSTIECPLEGGVELSLKGKNFDAEGGIIYADGSFITNINHDISDPHSGISFVLPAGEGRDRELYFINNRGEISNTFYYSYKE